ncbi:universal stress protein [Arthrobacter caoxuetaonis]|uniref:Universal stress protein n=1 Tax=Arthrobacter caoxuetaonis TaxID=2886935 RepID=A0A9X1MF02_9MICC|nr:universal stress protein [Arthrobacter caoxuetaonis]MCC3283409.1 universal stress protein [Arthrobacter caoxuetaonis]MCC3298808.1 universal stress protein [Arthrobacter caoxuetaonis]USQ55842.1 universal stress protein [Arthrobacter caoxuetaonis]
MASIVVGYVPGAEGAAALAQARRVAELFQDELAVVNVRTTGRGLGHGHAHGEDAADDLNSIAAELESAGLSFEIIHPEGDYDPADEILAVASRLGARLIVVGLRHRTPVGKLFLGSTAQRILLEASCPVLAVKAGQALQD